MKFKSVNPATEEELSGFHRHSPAESAEIIEKCALSVHEWGLSTLRARSELLRGLAEVLERGIEGAACLITAEMGKPLSQSVAELQKCEALCRWVATEGERILSGRLETTEFGSSRIEYAPLGVLLAIMPWNFPFWQVFRVVVPAVIGGNGVVIKHAPNTFGCADAIVSFFENANFPVGLVSSARVDVVDVQAMIEHPSVRGVTFTGSTLAGRSVARLAGSVGKKSVLELGGSDPYIVLADADVAMAVKSCVEARCINNGQSCIAAKRFLVHKSVADEFISSAVSMMDAHVVGNPMNADTQIGPLARADLRSLLLSQVERSISEGASLLTKRELLDVPPVGYYVRPALLLDRDGTTACSRQEVFGPVATISIFESDEQAILMANNSEYGLGAAVYGKSQAQTSYIASKLESGAVFINGSVRSHQQLPFGGVKNSGYGRELGTEGLLEFMNVRTIVEIDK